MSDYRAIAGVTGTLQQFLYGPLSAAIPGTTVRTGPPSASLLTGSAAAVNIFLYQVNPNASWRNRDLPTRRGDGTLQKRPQIGLDLYYILSFYGSESKMVPQLLLGATVSALHAHPMLDPASIPEFLDGKSLQACGLAEQAQVLKFTLMPLSHEELGRIWSVFFQVPYTLSVAYQCSVVLLESDLKPEPALPVLSTRLGAMPWEPARIDRVEPPVVEAASDAVIRLEGERLAGPRTRVWFGEIEAEPDQVTEEAVEVAVPATLRAGVHTVRVVHGQPGSRVTGARSTPASFVLLPRVVGAAGFESKEIAGKEVSMMTLPVEPPVGSGQSVELLLNEWPAPQRGAARSYRIKADPESIPGETLGFDIQGVGAGAYVARVEIDGVASRLSTEDDATSPEFGRFTAPRVEIP
jgi:hypothetical protein